MTSHSNSVLLVEDDDLVANSIAGVMRSRGYMVTPYRSGEELIANSPSEPKGCMIIDIDLGPLKMTGLDLLRWMRSRKWTIPVIVLSGKVTVSEAVEALKETVVDIISKPPSVPRLVSAVEVSLSWPSTAAKQNAAILRAQLQSLSQTEQSVLSMLLSGSSNKVIASRMDLSLRSAVRHRKAILDTFGLDTVPELASALGSADIRLTELNVPPAFLPGLPQQHRKEIRNQLLILKNSVASTNLDSLEETTRTIKKIEEELDLICRHSSLASPETTLGTPSVMIISEDVQSGGLLRDLLRAHGFFAECCTSLFAAMEPTVHVAAPPTYVIVFESEKITQSQLLLLSKSVPYNASKVVVVTPNLDASSELTGTNCVRFAPPISGQTLVNYLLDQLPE